MPAGESESKFLHNLFAGWLAGVGQVVVGQPFDAVKVRLQTNQQQASALRCLREIVQREGLCVLYKGSSAPLLGVGLISAVQFSARERFSPYGSCQSGLMSGLIGSVFICPFEAWRIRMQLNKQETSLFRTALHVGFPGCYKGFLSVVGRESIGMGVYFWVYDTLMGKFDTSRYSPLLAGGFAGLAYWSSIYPIDVVKTCKQSCISPSFCTYSSILCNLWRTNGFFRGVFPCLLRAFPVNAISFLLYERAQHLFQLY